jgi:predicted CXXCH cytochrome family protein
MNFFSPPNSRQNKNPFLILATRNLLIALMILAFLGIVNTTTVQADGLSDIKAAGAEQAQTPQHGSNCMLCHGMRNFTGTLGDGVQINLTVASETIKNNIHLRLGTCAICHKGFDGYPHPNTKGVNCSQCHANGAINTEINVVLPFENSRALATSTNDRCYICHQVEKEEFSKGLHAKILNSGNLSGPVCSDCHTSHSIQPAAKTNPSQMCAKCHEATVNSFMSSVHGAELAKQSPVDAVSCADCHDSHTLDGPNNPEFRKKVASTCLKCHQDKIMMNRYKIPADIFETSQDNYHAVKVNTGGKGNLDVAGNLPVCIDCHGVHSIMSGSNPGSTVSSANLLGTCQKCHSGDANFVVAGRAHLSSSTGSIFQVSSIQKFFGYFTPISVVIVAIYMMLDARKQWSERKIRLEKTNE